MAFAVVAWLTITNAPGWPRVQQSFFDLDTAVESLPAVLEGLWLNVRVLVVCAVLILIIGMGLAALRSLRGPVWFPLRALATGYVDLFRSLPLIICLYLIGFGLPGLRIPGIPTDPVVLGSIALVLVYSAYVAEVFRVGIESVHPSQRASARSLGLTHAQTMRIVVMPQAVRRVLPPLLNDFVALQKDCGLISVLSARWTPCGPRRSPRRPRTTSRRTWWRGSLFILLAVPSGRLADWVSARAARRQNAGGKP